MLSTEAVLKDMSIGIVVVMIGTMIYIIRILYKKERKRKFDLEGSNYDITMLVVVEHPPKRTAAKYLEGIKEATQKILRPLKKIASSKDSPSSLEIERNPSPYIISSTKSFKTKSRTSELLNYDFNYNSRVVSLISPPPPLHLKSQDENIEINSMQTSLSDTQPSSLKIPAQVPSRAQRSLMTSPISSRSSSRSSSRISLEMTSSRDPLNPKVSSENSIQPIAKDETNDYTNFQPIQNIKPIQNSQLLDKGKTVVG